MRFSPLECAQDISRRAKSQWIFEMRVIEPSTFSGVPQKTSKETYAFVSISGVRICKNKCPLGRRMARNLRDLKEVKSERAPRVKLSAKESLKRTQEFDKRKEQSIAAVRKGQS